MLRSRIGMGMNLEQRLGLIDVLQNQFHILGVDIGIAIDIGAVQSIAAQGIALVDVLQNQLVVLGVNCTVTGSITLGTDLHI